MFLTLARGDTEEYFDLCEKLLGSRVDICAVRSLGEGTVELEDRVFPTSPPAFDRGFAGVSNDSGCRIRRTAFLSLGRWVV